MNWCYASVTRETNHHSSAQSTDNLVWQQVKKRETTTSSRLALPFSESEKKLSKEGLHIFPRTQMSFLEGAWVWYRADYKRNLENIPSEWWQFAQSWIISQRSKIYPQRKRLLLQGSHSQLNSMEETELICCKLNQSPEPFEVWNGWIDIRGLSSNE